VPKGHAKLEGGWGTWGERDGERARETECYFCDSDT